MHRTIFTVAVSLLFVCQPALLAQTASWPQAVSTAAQKDPDAEIIVLDLVSNRLLASHRLADAARTLVAPGSSLKPIALYGVIQRGQWNPQTTIACNRKLRISGRELNCSHPILPPLNAREALAWSCNTYFASIAAKIPPAQLRELLAPSGLFSTTGLVPSEVIAHFRPPYSADEVQLTLLGVDGIAVTPLELAHAYRWLAQEFAAHPNTPATETVFNGMKDSADFGIADNANRSGVALAGKTGTAVSNQGSYTHGWFAALAPADKPRVVLVVYLPTGHGADAAAIASQVLTQSPLREK